MADPKAFKGLGNLPAAPAAPKPVAPKPTTAVKPSVPAVPMTEPQKRAAEEFAGQTNVGLAVQKAKQEQIKLQQDLRYEILKRYPNLSLDEVNRLVDEEAAKFVQPLAASSFAGTIDPYSLISPSKQPMNIPATQPPGFIDVFRPQTRAPYQEKIAYSQANPYDSSASIQRILDQGLPKEEQENALAILKAKSAVFSKLKQKNPGLNIIQLSSMVENEIANLPTAMSGTGEKTVVRQPMAGNLQEQTPLEAAFDIQQTGAEVPKLTEAQLEYNRVLKKEQLPTLLARERAKLEQELVPETRFETIVTPGFPEGYQQEINTGRKRKLTEAEINERLLKFQDEAIPWWADPEKLEEYKTKGAPPSTIGILSTELVTGNVVEAPVGYAMRVLTAPLNAIAGAAGYTIQSIYDAAMGTDIQAKKEAGRGEKFQAPGLKSNIIANIATGGGYTSEIGEFGYYNPNETIQSFYPAFYGFGFLVDLAGVGDIGLIKGAAGGVRGAAAGARAATTAAAGAPAAVKAAEFLKGGAQFGTKTAATEFIRELPIVGEKLAKEISPDDVRVVYGEKLGKELKDAVDYSILYDKVYTDNFRSFEQVKSNIDWHLKNKTKMVATTIEDAAVRTFPNDKKEEAIDKFARFLYDRDFAKRYSLDENERQNLVYQLIKDSGFFDRNTNFAKFAKDYQPSIVLEKLDPKSKSFYFKGFEDEFNETSSIINMASELKANVDLDTLYKFYKPESFPKDEAKILDPFNMATKEINKAPAGYTKMKKLNASEEAQLKPYVTFLARKDPELIKDLKSIGEIADKYGEDIYEGLESSTKRRMSEIQKLIGSSVEAKRIRPSDILTTKFLAGKNRAFVDVSNIVSFAAGVKAVDKSLSKIGLTGTRLVAVTPKTFAAPKQADRIMEAFKKGDLYQNVTSKLSSFDTTQFKNFYGDIVNGVNLSEKELDAIQTSLGSGYASGLITRKDFIRINSIATDRKLISYDDLRLLSYAEVDIIAKEMKQGITSEMLAEAPVSAKIDQPIIAKTVAQQRRVEELKSDLPLLANRALNWMKDKIEPIKAQLNPQQIKLVDEALGRVSALNITLRDEYQRSLKDPEYAALYEINKDDDVEERIIKLSIGTNRSKNSRELYIKELISSMIFSTDNTALYNAFFSGYHFGASALDYVDKMNDIINKYSGLRPKEIRNSLEEIYQDVKNLVETDINPIRKARGGKIFTIPKDMQRDALIVAYFRFKVLNITADTLTRSISNRPFSISNDWYASFASFAAKNAYKFNTPLLTLKDYQKFYYSLMKSELMNTDASSLSSLIAKYNDNIYQINAYDNLATTQNTTLLPSNIKNEITNLEFRNEDIIAAAGQRSLPKIETEQKDFSISDPGFEFGLKTPEPPKSDVKEAKTSDTWPGGDFGDSDVEVPEEVVTEQLPEPEIKFTPEELQEIKDNKDKIESIIKNYMDETKTKVNELRSTNPNLITDFLRPVVAETFKNFSPQQIEATTKTMADALVAKPELIEDVKYGIQSLVDTGIINRLPNSDAGSLEDTIRTLDLLARENVSPNSFASPAMVEEIKKQLGGEPKFNQLMNELARLSDAAAGGSANAIAVSIVVRKALQMWNSFYYNMMLSINPRFQFPNILVAPFIISYTTGKNVIGRESLNNAKSAMKAMAMGSPMATEAGRRSIAVVDKFGVPYTHGDIYDLCVKRGVFKSQASTEIPANFLEDARAILNSGIFKEGPLTTRAQVTAGDVARARGPIAKILSPVEEFIGDPMATYTDNVWRAFVVIDAIKGGSTIDDALMLGRKSLFDYGNVTSVERDFARRFFVFYNYFRQGVGQFVKNLFEDPSRTIKLMRLNKGISEGSMAIFGGEKEDVSFYYPPDWGVSRAVFSVTPAKKYKEGKAILAPNMPYSDGLNVIGGVLVDPVGAVIGPQKAAGMGRAFEEGLFKKQLGPIWEMAGLMFFTPNALNTIKLTKNRIPPEHMALYYVAGLDQHVTSTFNVRVEDAKPGENALDGKAFVVDAEDFERYKMLVAATQTVGVSRPMSDWGKVFGGAGVMIGRNPRLTGSYPENLPEFLANTTGAITVSGAGRPSDVQVEVLEAQQLQMQKKQKELEEKQVIQKPKIER